jgi:hypothetical protein
MTIGMGIALGAHCLRASASLHEMGGAGAPIHYRLGDFEWAFAMAALLTLVSVIGYVRLPRKAGSAIGGGAFKRSVRSV